MNTYPVRVGSCLFTMVDPERGHEVDYNRWYERDHFYAGCLIGPWLFAGRRWVATRDLKDLRFPEDSPLAVPTEAGSYLAIYWVHEGRHREHFAWAIDQVVELYKDGRGFSNRIHAHTAAAPQAVVALTATTTRFPSSWPSTTPTRVWPWWRWTPQGAPISMGSTPTCGPRRCPR